MRYLFSMAGFTLALLLVVGINSRVIQADEMPAQVATLRLAVAADFADTAKLLGQDFTTGHGVPVVITSGASGELNDQIRSGGEFDVFLSANVQYPKQLIKDELASNELLIYANGTVALFSPDQALATDGEKLLASGTFTKLAIADPKRAPYGGAAIESLNRMKLYVPLKGSLRFAGNIANTLEMVKKGGAEAGFVAYADLTPAEKKQAWVIPPSMHEPIQQAAVILVRARENDSASQWMEYLASEPARQIIRNAGYRL